MPVPGEDTRFAQLARDYRSVMGARVSERDADAAVRALLAAQGIGTWRLVRGPGGEPVMQRQSEIAGALERAIFKTDCTDNVCICGGWLSRADYFRQLVVDLAAARPDTLLQELTQSSLHDLDRLPAWPQLIAKLLPTLADARPSAVADLLWTWCRQAADVPALATHLHPVALDVVERSGNARVYAEWLALYVRRRPDTLDDAQRAETTARADRLIASPGTPLAVLLDIVAVLGPGHTLGQRAARQAAARLTRDYAFEPSCRLLELLPRGGAVWQYTRDLVVSRTAEDAPFASLVRLLQLLPQSDPAFGQMCAWVVSAARRCDTLADLEAAARALPTWYSPRVEVLDRICDRAAGHGSPDAVHRLITWLETDRPSTEKWRDLVAAASRLDVKHPAVTAYRREQECLAGVARRQEQQLARDRFVEAWSAGGPVARLVSAAQQDAFPVRWLPDEWAAVSDADLAAVSDETLTALIGRLVPTRKGPWRALRRQLKSLRHERRRPARGAER